MTQNENNIAVTSEEIAEERKLMERKLQQVKAELERNLNDPNGDFYERENNEIREYIKTLENVTDEDLENQVLWKREQQKKQEESYKNVVKMMNKEAEEKATPKSGEMFSYDDTHPIFTLTNKTTGRQTSIQTTDPDPYLNRIVKDFAKLHTVRAADEVIEKIRNSGFDLLSSGSRIIIYNDDVFYDFDKNANSSSWNYETQKFEYDIDPRNLNEWDFKDYVSQGLKITKRMKEFEKIENKETKETDDPLSHVKFYVTEYAEFPTYNDTENMSLSEAVEFMRQKNHKKNPNKTMFNTQTVFTIGIEIDGERYSNDGASFDPLSGEFDSFMYEENSLFRKYGGYALNALAEEIEKQNKELPENKKMPCRFNRTDFGLEDDGIKRIEAKNGIYDNTPFAGLTKDEVGEICHGLWEAEDKGLLDYDEKINHSGRYPKYPGDEFVTEYLLQNQANYNFSELKDYFLEKNDINLAVSGEKYASKYDSFLTERLQAEELRYKEIRGAAKDMALAKEAKELKWESVALYSVQDPKTKIYHAVYSKDESFANLGEGENRMQYHHYLTGLNDKGEELYNVKAPNGIELNQNGLTAKEIDKLVQNDFEKYQITHSKEFISKFGDWEKANRLEKLRNTESVEKNGKIILNGSDITNMVESLIENEDRKGLQSIEKEIGKTVLGSYINPDTNLSINVSNRNVTEISNHHYLFKEHIQSVAYIPEIIEKAIFIDEIENEDKQKHPNIEKYLYFGTGLKIDGADYTCKSVIGMDSSKNCYYDQSLSTIEKGKLIDYILENKKAGNLSPLITQRETDLEGNTVPYVYYDKRLLNICQVPQLEYLEKINDKWYPTDEAIELVKQDVLKIERKGQEYLLIDNRLSSRQVNENVLFRIVADKAQEAELREHLSMNGYDIKWNDRKENEDVIEFSTDIDSESYVATILKDREIDFMTKQIIETSPVTLEEILDVMEMRPDVQPNGKIMVFDRQRGEYIDNRSLLPDYDEDNWTFDSAAEIFERLDIYINDYYVHDMEEQLKEGGVTLRGDETLEDLCAYAKEQLEAGITTVSQGELNLAMGIVHPETVIMPEIERNILENQKETGNNVEAISESPYDRVTKEYSEKYKDFYDTYDKMKEAFIENESRYIGDARIRSSFIQAHDELVKLQIQELNDIIKESANLEEAKENTIRYFNFNGNDGLTMNNLYLATKIGFYNQGRFNTSAEKMREYIENKFNESHTQETENALELSWEDLKKAVDGTKTFRGGFDSIREEINTDYPEWSERQVKEETVFRLLDESLEDKGLRELYDKITDNKIAAESFSVTDIMAIRDDFLEDISAKIVNGSIKDLNQAQDNFNGLFEKNKFCQELVSNGFINNKELTSKDLENARVLLTKEQYQVVLKYTQGEEAEHFKGIIKNISAKAEEIKGKYELLGENEKHPLAFKYTLGSSSFYVSEWDGKDELFGYTVLNGDTQMSEWGYTSLEELKNAGGKDRNGFPVLPEMTFYGLEDTIEKQVSVDYPSLSEKMGFAPEKNHNEELVSEFGKEMFETLKNRKLEPNAYNICCAAQFVLRTMDSSERKEVFSIMEKCGCQGKNGKENTEDFLTKCVMAENNTAISVSVRKHLYEEINKACDNKKSNPGKKIQNPNNDYGMEI